MGNSESGDAVYAVDLKLHGNTKVYVQRGDYAEWVSLSEARKRSDVVVMCSQCGKRPATELDVHFPYMWHYNTCTQCARRGRK